MVKKYFIIIFIISTGIVLGMFLFMPVSKTFYIKNGAARLNLVVINQKVYQAEDKIGDLSNIVIPKITVPENLTKDFSGILAKAIIGKNNQPKTNGPSGEPRLNVPNPDKIAGEFIASGLKQANENILKIKLPEIKISQDNSKKAVEIYLSETQKILKDNLKGEPLLSILEEINKNKGQGLEKLLQIMSAHEAAANQIEIISAPSDLKYLMTEEIRLLRITANVLRALTNIEIDPLGGVMATRQFGAVIQRWANLQFKFNDFIVKLNKN